MKRALFIGSNYYCDFFAFLGFSTYVYRGLCDEALDFIEKNLESTKIVVISRTVETECIDIIKKKLENHEISYLIIPEPSDIEKENVDEYYDKLIKILIGA